MADCIYYDWVSVCWFSCTSDRQLEKGKQILTRVGDLYTWQYIQRIHARSLYLYEPYIHIYLYIHTWLWPLYTYSPTYYIYIPYLAAASLNVSFRLKENRHHEHTYTLIHTETQTQHSHTYTIDNHTSYCNDTITHQPTVVCICNNHYKKFWKQESTNNRQVTRTEAFYWEAARVAAVWKLT